MDKYPTESDVQKKDAEWEKQKIAEREKANIHQEAGTWPDHAYSIIIEGADYTEEFPHYCLLDAEDYCKKFHFGFCNFKIIKYDRMVGDEHRDIYDWENGYTPYPIEVDLDAVD